MTIQLRRDTAANWTAANPTLADGQPGYETDTKKLKIGDGATAWASLAYFSGGGGGSYSYTVTTRAASYSETATSGDQVVLVTGGAVNVSLPTAVGNTARFTFKLTVAGTMTLTASGGQTIDGASTAVTSIQYTAITLISDNANWQVI